MISELKPTLNVGSEKLFLYYFLLVVSTIGSISFVSLFFILLPVPLFIFVFLNVCNNMIIIVHF